MKAFWRIWAASLTAMLLLSPCWALTAQQAQTLARGEDGDVRVAALHEALQAHARQPDARLQPFLRALADDQLKLAGERLVIQRGDGTLLDALSAAPLAPVAALDDISVNNRLRGELDQALAALQLDSTDAGLRRAAAQALLDAPNESYLPLIERALAAESEAGVRVALDLARAAALLGSSEPVRRLQAARDLAHAPSAATELLLNQRLAEEPDARVKAALQTALQRVRETLAWGERLAALFTGLSLGSILLLVALGLAITYGLMGVINMAHGELLMIGAYATWGVQLLFRRYLPPAFFDAYLLAAVPLAFGSAALVGLAMERTVLRWLYGRPLETLLATWGLSLVLMQTVRSLFGAQNVGVENPGWMSGSVAPLPALLPNLLLPVNRLVILAFAALVLLAISLLIQRTRLGLFVRGVTQNRAMAGCLGVNTARVDSLAFALGSGLAGLAGCALSQIGNVGPDLGQSHVVDAFMVVVLGGVGQLAGSVYAALGLGLANKLLEGVAGAVLAKIAVLVFIIAAIQKRPQGLFAAKGRT